MGGLSVSFASTEAVNKSCYFCVFVELGALGGDRAVAVFERTFMLTTHQFQRCHLRTISNTRRAAAESSDNLRLPKICPEKNYHLFLDHVLKYIYVLTCEYYRSTVII